jgi:predicted DNA-binding transcriptional regulator YafY
MAVDRLVHGDRPEQPRRVDVFHAVTYLERTESLSARQIAERVGVSSRTVVRIRGKLREGVPYGIRVQR